MFYDSLMCLELSERLYEDGFADILSTDYSESVIELMKLKYSTSIPSLKWAILDMRNMVDLKDASFDIIIDKCALDAIWSDGSSVWDPSETLKDDVRSSLSEFHRVLKPSGKFLFVSFGQPHFRIKLLSTPGWDVKFIQIGMYFMYIMEK